MSDLYTAEVLDVDRGVVMMCGGNTPYSATIRPGEFDSIVVPVDGDVVCAYRRPCAYYMWCRHDGCLPEKITQEDKSCRVM